MEFDPPTTDAPRWLNDDERRAWLALVSVVIRLPQELDRQLRRDADLSHFDYQVLVMLSESEAQTLRMSELAALTESSLPRLSQVVRKLEGRGWVSRCPDPDDGRYTLAALTDDGWNQLVATAPGHVEAVRRLVFDPLGGHQVQQMEAICSAMLTAIDPSERRDVRRPDPTVREAGR